MLISDHAWQLTQADVVLLLGLFDLVEYGLGQDCRNFAMVPLSVIGSDELVDHQSPPTSSLRISSEGFPRPTQSRNSKKKWLKAEKQNLIFCGVLWQDFGRAE